MKHTVARYSWMYRTRLGGDASSSSVAAAPKRSGNTASPPNPNVNASGGDPMKTSSGVTPSTSCAYPSAMISRSRWKCIVAFGSPVVPDVKPSSATSSRPVATAS